MKRREFLSTVGLAGSACALGTFTLSAQSAGVRPPRIKIAQIGTAHAHASGKMQTMRKLSDDFEVVGVVEPDPQRRAAAARLGMYASIPFLTEEQLFNTKGLQAVAVETEVDQLLPNATRAIAAGLHVHLDKPAGESLSQYRRLLGEATRKRLTVQMGYMFRYNPGFDFCFHALRDGWLGKVFSIEAAMSKALSPAERRPLLKYTGGSMFELGCHVIDSVVRALGRPQKVTPYARSSSALGDGFLDNQFAVLEYPGATSVVRSTMLEIEGGLRRQFTVCGDLGTIEIRPLEAPKVRLALDRPRGEFKKGYQDVPLPKMTGRYDGDFADLAKVIRGEKAFEFTPEHDLAVQETVLLASGRPLN